MIEPKDGEWWKVELNSGDVRVMRYWLRDGDSDSVWNVFQDESDSFIRACITVKPLYKMVKAEEPKPRTKTVYEKVEYEKLSDLVVDCENSIDIYIEHAQTGEKKLTDIYGAISMFRHGDALFQKVEKEIDWKDVLDDFGGRTNGLTVNVSSTWSKDALIQFCHEIAEITDKPE